MAAWIGTSGWVYKHWLERFYPDDVPERKWLEFYAGCFKTVELNNSFYHLPRDSTFEGWRERTPADFLFAVKASRYMTHIKRLAGGGEPVERFFSAARRLEAKLAVVLFQLPPSLKADSKLLSDFLGEVRGVAGREVRVAFEFRDASWLVPEVFRVLETRGAALAFADYGEVSPMAPVTADFVYLRRHGPHADHRYRYDKREIERDADAVKKWLGDGLDVFAYYNNDYNAYAVENARELIRLIG